MLKSVLWKPLKIIGLFFHKLIVINLYKIYLLGKKSSKAIFPSDKIRPLYLFINKYLPHLVIIILVVSVSFTNIFTRETRAEGFGEKSILYALATGSNMEDDYIEETIETSQPKVTSYLGTGTPAISAPQQILTTQETSPEATSLSFSGEGEALVKPELASIEASKKQRDKSIEYIVQSGDTISSIAQNFGITSDTILWENNLNKFSIINPGQKLIILPTSGISYKVAKGDTLAAIAKKYQSDETKIIEFNKLADESDLQVGQILIIPEGQPYYVSPPQTKLASITQIFQPTAPALSDPTKMLWPTTARRISQYFSWRHTGLDIDGDFGDPIWAADDGVVIKVAYLNTGYGYHVIIDHGGGKTTTYAHLQKIYVKQGQKVARGEVLGEEGSTGHSTGSHLHFEVRFNGKVYNPLSYIK